jgi:hypothetical protein
MEYRQALFPLQPNCGVSKCSLNWKTIFELFTGDAMIYVMLLIKLLNRTVDFR